LFDIFLGEYVLRDEVLKLLGLFRISRFMTIEVFTPDGRVLQEFLKVADCERKYSFSKESKLFFCITRVLVGLLNAEKYTEISIILFLSVPHGNLEEEL